MKSLSFVVAVLACLASAEPAASQTPAERKAAEAAMMKADRDFNRTVADGDSRRFLSFVTENAIFAGGAEELRGRDAIAKGWAPFFEKDGPKLTWQPTKAEALAGGTLGYTVGTWTRRRAGANEAVITTKGQYLTVWQLQKDGTWQVVYDTGDQEK